MVSRYLLYLYQTPHYLLYYVNKGIHDHTEDDNLSLHLRGIIFLDKKILSFGML
jgi:hypothetical protein